GVRGCLTAADSPGVRAAAVAGGIQFLSATECPARLRDGSHLRETARRAARSGARAVVVRSLDRLDREEAGGHRADAFRRPIRICRGSAILFPRESGGGAAVSDV